MTPRPLPSVPSTHGSTIGSLDAPRRASTSGVEAPREAPAADEGRPGVTGMSLLLHAAALGRAAMVRSACQDGASPPSSYGIATEAGEWRAFLPHGMSVRRADRAAWEATAHQSPWQPVPRIRVQSVVVAMSIHYKTVPLEIGPSGAIGLAGAEPDRARAQPADGEGFFQV